MKKILFILIFCFIAISNTAFSRSKIAVLFPSKPSDEPWKTHAELLKYEANRRNIDVMIFFANYKHETQYLNMERAIANLVQSIILVPVDYLKAGIIVDKASEAGRSVITYNQVPIKTRNISMHMAFDYNRIGKIKAEYILSRAPRGNYIIFMGSPTDYIAALSYEGAMNTIEPYARSGDIKIIASQAIIDGTYEEAISISRALLAQSGGEINGAILPNDKVAKGVIKAIEEKKYGTKCYIAGENVDIESAQRILLGKQDLSILLNSKVLAIQALEAAEYYAKGEFFPTRDYGRPFTVAGVGAIPTFYVEPEIVTKENLDKVLIESGIFKRRDIYTKDIEKQLINQQSVRKPVR